MKKLNKFQKFIIASLSVFIGLAVVFGLSANIITACAEDVQNSTGNTEILDDSATDEEVIDSEEASENDGVLDEETDTKQDNGVTLDEIKDYLDSRKDANGKIDFTMILTDVKFWIIQAILFLTETSAGAAILGVINSSNKRKEILTDAQIEKVANAAAKASTEKLIGKSIDVDISAEVSKAVKQELSALNNSVNLLVDGVKNAEMLSAEVAMAQSRSRLLTDEERHALRDAAAKVQEHAGKKVISAPKVKIKTKTEKEKAESAPAVTEDVAQKNMYFINFDGVEKK